MPLSERSFLARPKSVTLGWPSASSSTFPGFRSRWITPVLMGVLHRLGDLDNQGGRLARRERTLGDSLGQTLALDKAHAEVMLALVLANLEDGDNAGMVQVGGGLGLEVEALDLGLARQVAREDHLEGDGPVEFDLPGFVDDAHAAAGDLALKFVVAEIADDVAERQVGREPVAIGGLGG